MPTHEDLERSLRHRLRLLIDWVAAGGGFGSFRGSRVEGLEPVVVEPVGGRGLDMSASAGALRRDWWKGLPVSLLVAEATVFNDLIDVKFRNDGPGRVTIRTEWTPRSLGSSGFTATDTRTLRDLRTGQTRSETRTVTYNPLPTIRCTR